MLVAGPEACCDVCNQTIDSVEQEQVQQGALLYQRAATDSTY